MGWIEKDDFLKKSKTWREKRRRIEITEIKDRLKKWRGGGGGEGEREEAKLKGGV